VVESEPQNNAVQLFSEIQDDFRSRGNDETVTAGQVGQRKAVTKQMLRRNKARVTEEDEIEGELAEQIRKVTPFTISRGNIWLSCIRVLHVRSRST
jgi:hypothetical protein